MSWELCTSAVAISKAGVNVNEDLKISGTQLAAFSDLVEGTVCMKTRRDWVTTAGETQIMNAVADVVSDLIAIKMIEYDMSGFIKGEDQTMLDVLTTNSDTIIKDLREANFQGLNK